jgi:2-dehydropantoate 2-reductase
LRVVVIGAGAMGGIFASGLDHAGADTVIVDTNAAIAQSVASAGLRVRTPDGVATTYPRVASEIPDSFDLAFVFVKAQHTASVADRLRNKGQQATVVSLQNGWGNADVLAGSVASDRLVIGVTYHSGTATAPGVIDHTGTGPTFVGPLYGRDLARAHAVRDVLSSAAFDVEATADVETEIWKKLVLNAATLPVAALTGLPAGEAERTPEVLAVSDALAGEAVSVARARGLGIELDERLDRIRTVLRGAGKGKASMLQDVEARRKTEIEAVTGAVIHAGATLGVATPLSSAMLALVHGMERSWSL